MASSAAHRGHRLRSLNPHRRDGRNAEWKREGRIKAAIDKDLDRHALHDLDEIARRILGRKGGEFRTRPKLDAVHMALEVEPGIGIDLDLHRLPWAYPGELGLLEI